MFDIGASELLLIVIVAVVVIGPKDLPLAMRTAGRWIAKLRRVSGHFRAGIDTMVREAEMEEREREWKERNAAIMKAHPDIDASGNPAAMHDSVAASAEAGAATPGEPHLPPPPP
jgi:sec-independent protein translocase protein TatB